MKVSPYKCLTSYRARKHLRNLANDQPEVYHKITGYTNLKNLPSEEDVQPEDNDEDADLDVDEGIHDCAISTKTAVNAIISGTLGDYRLTMDNTGNITTVAAAETLADTVELEERARETRAREGTSG
jgi:hypothetical protein